MIDEVAASDNMLMMWEPNCHRMQKRENKRGTVDRTCGQGLAAVTPWHLLRTSMFKEPQYWLDALGSCLVWKEYGLIGRT